MSNGNKRVSLLFLIGVLRYFGYHLHWSKGIYQNYDHYKPEIAEFVKDLENGYNDKDINKIARWIKEKSVIAIEWRKKYEKK